MAALLHMVLLLSNIWLHCCIWCSSFKHYMAALLHMVLLIQRLFDCIVSYGAPNSSTIWLHCFICCSYFKQHIQSIYLGQKKALLQQALTYVHHIKWHDYKYQMQNNFTKHPMSTVASFLGVMEWCVTRNGGTATQPIASLLGPFINIWANFISSFCTSASDFSCYATYCVVCQAVMHWCSGSKTWRLTSWRQERE